MSMRWVVDYELASGIVGVMIFSAEDEPAAEEFVSDLSEKYGHSHVSSPTPLPIEATVANLYELYPRLEKVVRT
jgi:hypothetical protein